MVNGKPVPETGWNLDNSYANLPELYYTSLNPTPVREPKLIILNGPLAASLGLNSQALQSNAGVAVFAGNRIPEGARPLAQAYADINLGILPCWGTAGPSCWANRLLRQESGLTSSLRVQAKRHTPAGAMAGCAWTNAARIHHQRSNACFWYPDHPQPGGGDDRRDRHPRNRAAGCNFDQGGSQSPAGRDF